MRYRYFLFVILFVLFIAGTIFSQIVLQGIITDETGTAVNGALVELINLDDANLHFSDLTDEYGLYVIAVSDNSAVEDQNRSPKTFSLAQNFPNPFNPSTVITYQIAEPGNVKLVIFNALGQKIKTLVDANQTELHGCAVWNGTDDRGNGVPAGIYIYVFRSGQYHESKKMLLIDGHYGSPAISQNTIDNHGSSINKTVSTQYTFKITGPDIESYERTPFVLVSSMVFDVQVKRKQTNAPPSAQLTVTPNPVTAGQQYTLNASGTTDDQDDVSTLMFRFDSNGDGVFAGWVTGNAYFTDTQNTPGSYTAVVEVLDSGGQLGSATCTYTVINAHNQAPVAQLVVAPNPVAAGEQITMNASGTTDDHDNISQLQFRYDAENDGVFSNWGTGNSVGYEIVNTPGQNTAVVEVKDTQGLVSTAMAIYTVNGHLEANPAAGLILTSSANSTGTLNVSSNTNWTISSDAEWLTINPLSGSNNQQVTVTANSQNISTSPRIGIITISGNGVNSVSITITQEGSDDPDTVTDIDGNVYHIVKIGNQYWMVENLRVTHYRNGDEIMHVADEEDWGNIYKKDSNGSLGAWCVYDNDPVNTSIYGLLYNWYAVDDSRNIAPVGWHVAKDKEWKELEMSLGMSQAEADFQGWRGNEGAKLKETGTTHWNSPNTRASNESGFTALPGGYRSSGNSGYYDMGTNACIWSSSRHATYEESFYRTLSHDSAAIGRYHVYNHYGYSVRCVRD